jgi:hypothetical protein
MIVKIILYALALGYITPLFDLYRMIRYDNE